MGLTRLNGLDVRMVVSVSSGHYHDYLRSRMTLRLSDLNTFMSYDVFDINIDMHTIATIIHL